MFYWIIIGIGGVVSSLAVIYLRVKIAIRNAAKTIVDAVNDDGE